MKYIQEDLVKEQKLSGQSKSGNGHQKNKKLLLTAALRYGGGSGNINSSALNKQCAFRQVSASKPPQRKAANRYAQPYLAPCKLETDCMKRAFFKTERHELTALSDRQRYEVLFFATAHFLIFNFIATAQNTLSFFLPTHEPNAEKKMKECFLQRTIFQ